MASFVSANLGSDSDSDDQDYDPTKDVTGEVVSEEDGSGDDEDGTGSKKKKGLKTKKGSKRKQEEKLGKRAGGILFVDDDDDAALKAEEERKNEFEQEKVEKKEEDEKKKLDDLWADFKKDVKPVATAAKPKPAGSGLGSWSMASKNSKTSKKVSSTAPPKKNPTSVFSSIFDNLGDDSKSSTKAESKTVEVPRSIISSIFEEKKIIPTTTTSAASLEKDETSSQDKASVTEDGDKVTITKVFDFAGESIEIRKEVSKDSKEAQKFLKETGSSSSEAMTSSGGDSSTGGKRPGGLNSIMGIIAGKKAKLGTLDKSKMDWNTFVEQEGIKEDLQTHNKGKEGYVEKQMFLERADLRRFEIEKAAREKTRKTLNR